MTILANGRSHVSHGSISTVQFDWLSRRQVADDILCAITKDRLRKWTIGFVPDEWYDQPEEKISRQWSRYWMMCNDIHWSIHSKSQLLSLEPDWEAYIYFAFLSRLMWHKSCFSLVNCSIEVSIGWSLITFLFVIGKKRTRPFHWTSNQQSFGDISTNGADVDSIHLFVDPDLPKEVTQIGKLTEFCNLVHSQSNLIEDHVIRALFMTNSKLEPCLFFSLFLLEYWHFCPSVLSRNRRLSILLI